MEQKIDKYTAKPCPFCGGQDLCIEAGPAMRRVFCYTCGAQGPAVLWENQEAWKKWNERKSCDGDNTRA